VGFVERLVERDGRCTSPDVRPHPKPYRPPTLTVYGSVRDLTRGYGQGKPDSGVSHSHSMLSPFGSSGNR
jgi:hypothetical protein